MATPVSASPVLLICAAFSRHEEALDWARTVCAQEWGPIALESQRFRHDETTYYEAAMGTGLLKTFFAFERLIDPARLVDFKLQSNAWEEQCRADHPAWSESRPLNLDPGYLTEAKLVLATAKDRDHRIYLGRGIYAEQTLYYRQGTWRVREWTYPDYRRADYHEFFQRCREYLRGG